MMSRNDYQKIAKIIAKRQIEKPADALDNGYYMAVWGISQELADFFEADNPRFDRARFMEACGGNR